MFDVSSLPKHATAEVLAALKQDSKFDLGGVHRSTDLTPEQIATHAVALAFTSEWINRLDLDTRDRLRRIAEIAFTPKPEPFDPLAAAAVSAPFDAYARERELHADVTEIAAAGPDTSWRVEGDDEPPMPSAIVRGGIA